MSCDHSSVSLDASVVLDGECFASRNDRLPVDVRTPARLQMPIPPGRRMPIPPTAHSYLLTLVIGHIPFLL